MSSWFYYDNNGQKLGPVSGGQLKGLAKVGLITPETIVETEEGVTVPAKWIKGLKFAPKSPIDEKDSIFPVEGEIYDLESLSPEFNELVPQVETNPSAPIADSSIAASKAKWYYYKDGEKINVTSRQLKELAKEGLITQDTIVEDKTGRSIQAKRVKGLKFAETPPIDEESIEFSDEESIAFPFEESLYDLTSLLSEPAVPHKKVNPSVLTEDIEDTFVAGYSAAKWYYYDIAAQKNGPYDEEQLITLAQKGVITPDTFVITPSGKSRPAKSLKGLVFSENFQQAINLQKRRRIYVVVLGLILALLSYTGVWWFLLIGWLAWGAILALVLFPMIAMDSASKAVDMID